MSQIHTLTNGPDGADMALILAHGAGAHMDSPFMNFFAEALGAQGILVVRFEFPYMIRRRAEGTKRPPDRQPVLLESWRQIIDQVGHANVVIGGKSMGGRMASMIADDERPKGLVLLGYPFHPPGRPEKTRVEHLKELETPTIICQGSRDTMGNKDMVETFTLSDAINIHWVEDGDHSFKPRKRSGKPRKRSGRTEDQNWGEAAATIADFIKGL